MVQEAKHELCEHVLPVAVEVHPVELEAKLEPAAASLLASKPNFRLQRWPGWSLPLFQFRATVQLEPGVPQDPVLQPVPSVLPRAQTGARDALSRTVLQHPHTYFPSALVSTLSLESRGLAEKRSRQRTATARNQYQTAYLQAPQGVTVADSKLPSRESHCFLEHRKHTTRQTSS